MEFPGVCAVLRFLLLRTNGRFDIVNIFVGKRIFYSMEFDVCDLSILYIVNRSPYLQTSIAAESSDTRIQRRERSS